MKQRKFMLCRYPKDGFGQKSGTFYLLDVWGNRYEIKDEYDKVLGEMNKVVTVNGMTFAQNTMESLVEEVKSQLDTKIERW